MIVIRASPRAGNGTFGRLQDTVDLLQLVMPWVLCMVHRVQGDKFTIFAEF